MTGHRTTCGTVRKRVGEQVVPASGSTNGRRIPLRQRKDRAGKL
nr:hypothetical protein JVH1_4314 [Rhodococcus sp. JVH1]